MLLCAFDHFRSVSLLLELPTPSMKRNQCPVVSAARHNKNNNDENSSSNINEPPTMARISPKPRAKPTIPKGKRAQLDIGAAHPTRPVRKPQSQGPADVPNPRQPVPHLTRAQLNRPRATRSSGLGLFGPLVDSKGR